MSAGHQQTNLFQGGNFRIDFTGDSSFMNDQQTIGKTRHFFELRRDEQDRTPRITQGDELPVNKLDRADVHAACRLRDEQQLGFDAIFAPDDQLLLVAAGKRTRRQRGVWRSHVEVLDDLACAPLNGVLVEKNSARERCNRRTIMHAEDRVFRKTKIEQEPATMTVFGNVRDSEFTPDSRAERVEILTFEVDLARDAFGFNEARECFDQLSLPVTFDTRDADDLSTAHLKRNAVHAFLIIDVGN